MHKNQELANKSWQHLVLGMMCGQKFICINDNLYFCHKAKNHKGVHFDAVQDHYYSIFNAKKQQVDWSEGLYV